MYKMFKIFVEKFAKNYFYNITDGEKKLRLRNRDIGERLGVKNIYDLIDKEIKEKSETKNPTNEQIREYKRHVSELIRVEKYKYTHDDIIIPIIMNCRVSTPKAIEFRFKLGFNLYDRPLSKEQSLISKPIKLFAREKKCCYIILS